MQLTGEQIVRDKIVNNFCSQGIQQQGVDIRLDKVYVLDRNSSGFIPLEGKTITPKKTKVNPIIINDKEVYNLSPGYYEVDFIEGCSIPENASLHYKTRSSLVRCGALIHSGQFDAGFKTDVMGGFLQVNLPINIERGARVAQALVFESYKVNNLYNGQWQNDKQRNNTI